MDIQQRKRGFHYLSVGQTLTLVYELTINDDEGGLATNEITINIMWGNTGPYVTDAISEGEIIEGDPLNQQRLHYL